MEGSPLRNAFKNLISQVLSELSQETVNSNPEEGVVLSLNTDSDGKLDGTLSVQTASGVYVTGSPVSLTKGAQVLVLTGDGRKVAIPR